MTDIQPIFNRRRIACHGCLRSPCNVKLDSFRGADRGGFGINPYGSHAGSSPRVGMDVVRATGEWRQRGFYPILDREGTVSNRLDRSLSPCVGPGEPLATQAATFSRSALAMAGNPKGIPVAGLAARYASSD